jgi:hypothetical protein
MGLEENQLSIINYLYKEEVKKDYSRLILDYPRHPFF